MKEQIEGLKTKIGQYEDKLKLCGEEIQKQDPEEERKKVLDLVEKQSQERKFLK